VVCNRDERRARPVALPPKIHDVGGRLAMFPVDPQGGGTWIGVNDAGVTVALLNAHGTVPTRDSDSLRSRGLVVPALMHCVSLPQAMVAVGELDPRGFEPFRVVVVHGGRVAVAASDGIAPIRCAGRPLRGPLLLTSSSLGDAAVGAPRQRLFERMVVRSRVGWLAGQARFHRHQWPHRPEISVRMERGDALTVSRTVIDVTSSARLMAYEAPVDAAAPERVRECCSLG
jgi:hypothetical protein